MRIALDISETLYEQLRREAARQGRTVSELVEVAVQTYFQQQKAELSPLPSFDMGEPLVDIADRDALYEAMDGPELRRMYGTPDPE